MKPFTQWPQSYLQTIRIKELQNQAIERNKVSLDEVLMVLADIICFDPAEMYDENGNLLLINKMPKKVLLCIQSFEVHEISRFGLNY